MPSPSGFSFHRGGLGGHKQSVYGTQSPRFPPLELCASSPCHLFPNHRHPGTLRPLSQHSLFRRIVHEYSPPHWPRFHGRRGRRWVPEGLREPGLRRGSLTPWKLWAPCFWLPPSCLKAGPPGGRTGSDWDQFPPVPSSSSRVCVELREPQVL